MYADSVYLGERITHSLLPKKKNSAYTRWLSTWYLRLFSGWIPPWTFGGKGLSIFTASLWSFEHSQNQNRKGRRRKITSKESSVWQQQQKQYIYCFKLTHQKQICGVAGLAARLYFFAHMLHPHSATAAVMILLHASRISKNLVCTLFRFFCTGMIFLKLIYTYISM